MPFTTLQQLAQGVVQLLYPHVCTGCGSDTAESPPTLCAQCFADLPLTNYFSFPNNPVERLFAGRIAIQNAGSAFFFTKQSVLQNVMWSIKYKGNREAAIFMGKQTGICMKESNRFSDIDIIVPLPLSRRRLQERGYNQAALVAKGIAQIMKKPVNEHSVLRNRNTATQTHKTRTDRWQTMQHVFSVTNTQQLKSKHILLVDDIVTTGATLEACGEAILALPGAMLSIATVAHTI